MPPKGKRKKTPLGGQRTAGLKEFRKWQEQKLFELQCAHDQEKQDLEQRQKQELAAFQEKAKQQRQEKNQLGGLLLLSGGCGRRE
mmetsp:Transcript_12678/g.25695  ORF Transcript_12678/g.25695 Transcript_12678/m.25695 type:complete len:85 (-) Transcript_12678:151-405(-)